MKKCILIVGEFSGVGLAFKTGFENLGHSVDIISDGDGYKSISGTRFTFRRPVFRYLSLITQSIFFGFRKYDYVLWLSPFVFKRPLFLIKWCNNNLLKVSQNHTLYCCTTDSVYWRYYPSNSDRNLLYGFLKDLDFKTHRFASKNYFNYSKKFIAKMSEVVASSEEYQIPYERFLDISLRIVRIPVLVPKTKLNRDSRYPFSHGITRPGFKGTEEILKLFNDQGIDVKTVEKISYNDFVNLLSQTKVYIDQFHSHIPGVAALSALFYSEYVLAGIRKDLIVDHYYRERCPFIDIRSYSGNMTDLVRGNKNQVAYNVQFLLEFHNPVTQAKLLLCE